MGQSHKASKQAWHSILNALGHSNKKASVEANLPKHKYKRTLSINRKLSKKYQIIFYNIAEEHHH